MPEKAKVGKQAKEGRCFPGPGKTSPHAGEGAFSGMSSQAKEGAFSGMSSQAKEGAFSGMSSQAYRLGALPLIHIPSTLHCSGGRPLPCSPSTSRQA